MRRGWDEQSKHGAQHDVLCLEALDDIAVEADEELDALVVSERPEMCSIVFSEALSAEELRVAEKVCELSAAVPKHHLLIATWWPHLDDLKQLALLSLA